MKWACGVLVKRETESKILVFAVEASNETEATDKSVAVAMECPLVSEGYEVASALVVEADRTTEPGDGTPWEG